MFSFFSFLHGDLPMIPSGGSPASAFSPTRLSCFTLLNTLWQLPFIIEVMPLCPCRAEVRVDEPALLLRFGWGHLAFEKICERYERQPRANPVDHSRRAASYKHWQQCTYGKRDSA
jgi:hypothetical protein